MSTNSNQSLIAAFTANYLFRGVVVTGTRRLSDVVNDKITAYIEISDARVYNLSKPEKPIYNTSEFYLKKQRIVAIAILKEETFASARRLYSFVPKERFAATIFLRAFELRGFLHKQGTRGITGPLTREGELFVPVTDATLTSTLNPRVKVSASTILLREEELDGYYLEEENSPRP
jgi:hypothetical protein